MRTLLFLIHLLCFGLALAFWPQVHAQSFHPFPGSHTYSYTFNYPGDTFVHALRVDTVYALGQDTVHEFNKIFRLNDSLDWFGGCAAVSSLPTYTYDSAQRTFDQPNIFGDFMLQRPNGRFDFVDTTRQDTFRLETQVPNGSSWLVNAPRSLTATMDSTIWMTFLGVSDSVKHISLCNGKQIQLSKNHGFIEAVPWIPIYHAGIPAADYPPEYKLRGINETGLGKPMPDIFAYFDFGSGDRFQFWNKVDAGLWVDDEQYLEQIIQSWGPTMPGIGGLVSEEFVRYQANFGNLDTTYQAPTIVFDSAQAYYFSYLTRTLPSASWSTDGNYNAEFIVESAKIVDDRWQIALRLFNCGSNNCIPGFIGDYEYYLFRENLGLVYHYRESPYGQDTQYIYEEMLCWETSWGMGGTCVNLLALATDVEDGLPLTEIAVHASPETGRMRLLVPHERLELALFDLNGKQLWRHTHLDTNLEMIEVEVPGLPAGVYVLEVQGQNFAPHRQKIRWVP